jgi:hypothetical protein
MRNQANPTTDYLIRVVNPGIPDDFGIVKSRDLNFGIFGIILIPGFAYRDPGPPGIDFIN